MGDINFAEIKSLLDEQGNAFEKFKKNHEDALAVERKEREALEARFNRGVFSPEHKGIVLNPAESKALSGFVRGGADDWSKDTELKTLSAGSDPDGGYLVLPTLSAGMSTRLFDFSPMRRLSRIETISRGDAFEEPDDRQEPDASWVGESSARPETGSPQLGKFRVELHELYANPKATQRLLDDADRDMGVWLEGKISDKFARTEGAAFVSGDGIAKPRGFLTYTTSTAADYTRTPGQIQYVASGNASSFPNTNQADVLKTMLWTLRTPYRAGAAWMMNSATAQAVDKFKDGQGNYIWRDSIVAGQPATLLGYPVEIDESMPDIAADAYPIAFGNFKLGYCIVDRPGIKLLRDPYTDKPNVNFYAYKRVGGGVMNDDAIKLLKIAAN